MEENGVGTVIHSPIPPHLKECYRPLLNLPLKGQTFGMILPEVGLPITEMLADCELSLPISPTMTMEEAAEVVRLVNAFSV